MPDTQEIVKLPLARWTEWARRDDWHQLFVGSDVRQMLGRIETLEKALREIAGLRGHDRTRSGDIASKALGGGDAE